MSNQGLQELLLIQAGITAVILAFTAVILAGALFDLGIHLYKKYIKKGDKNEKNIK